MEIEYEFETDSQKTARQKLYNSKIKDIDKNLISYAKEIFEK